MPCYSTIPTITSGSGCYEGYVGDCPNYYTKLYTQPYGGYQAACAGRAIQNVCAQSNWPSQRDNGTLLNCCMGNTDTTVCSPDDCYGSSSCNSSLSTYCNDPNNVFSSFCQSKVCPTILDCNNAMQRYCSIGDNIVSDTCTALRNNRPDLVENAMNAYCSRNPSAAICGCITITPDVKAVISKATAQGINFVVQCNLASCIPNSSWKPASMRSVCPIQSLCLPSIILDGVSTSQFGNINQTCNQDSGGDTPTTTEAPTDTTTTGLSFSLFGYTITVTQQQLYVLLGLLLTILVAVVVLFFGDEPKAALGQKVSSTSLGPPILDRLVT